MTMGRLEPGQGPYKSGGCGCNACKAMRETSLVTQAQFAEIFDFNWDEDEALELVKHETEAADIPNAMEKCFGWAVEKFAANVGDNKFMTDVWLQYKPRGN